MGAHIPSARDAVGGRFFQAEDGIRDWSVTGVQTCALPIYRGRESGAEKRTRLRDAVYLVGRRRAVRAGHRRVGQSRHTHVVRRSSYAGGHGAAWRGRRRATHSLDWIVAGEGAQCRGTVAPVTGQSRRRGTAGPRSTGGAARRRTQNRERGAERRV